MTTTIIAIYQNVVLRPPAPLPQVEGTAVRLVVSTEAEPVPVPRPTPEEVHARILAIADLAEEPTGQPEFASRDHYRVLYSDPHS